MSQTGCKELQKSAPKTRLFKSDLVAERVLVAIDSALGSAVAASKDGFVAEVVSDDPLGHAEAIGNMLQEALKKVGADPSELEAVVVGMGPGPFTGLRVGIAAAQGFALGTGTSLLPLTSHDAAAFACHENDYKDALRIVQDAKRRELFITQYESATDGEAPRQKADSYVQKREDFVPEEGDFWPERIPAARLLEVAAIKLAAGSEFRSTEALYLRQPDVNLIQPKNND